MKQAPKDQVKAFWENEACGERYGAEQDRVRYELEPEILPFADFESGARLRVLEIGVGMGADFLRWARAGAQATGVDLTERAVALTKMRLLEEHLIADVRLADAEMLPFPDNTFDIVYSWGVLHHTPNPTQAFTEAQRVLVPGGRLKLMLYHRRSWVALAAWAKFGVLRGRPFLSIKQAVKHIESPGTQAFTEKELRTMLPDLEHLRIRPVLTRWDRRCLPLLPSAFGNRFGWFLLLDGRKADSRTDSEAHP